MERGSWKSNWGFILAAIGSAVGLGNIWRFSYLCHKNGGGTFLVPYVIALLTTGLPLMILEFAIGHKMQGSAPHAMYKVSKKFEWAGWWPVLFVMFGIELYYCVVISWCGLYTIYSFGDLTPWLNDSKSFFFNDFLQASKGVTEFGSISGKILAMTLFVWILQWVICVRHVGKGIELACKIFMPILLILTTILVIWGLTLDGAKEGVIQYLKPDWSKLLQGSVWRDAFSQIFFTLSIGFGIMIAYASYLPKNTNLVRSAFITSIVNCSYSLFAGFAVFSVLGYMAKEQNLPVDQVVAGGPGLCFIVYPKAIALLPGFNGLFGALFFLTLFIAGITSGISILEAFAAAVIDKFKWERRNVITVTCIVGFMGSIVFTSGAGIYLLDIVDHFLNNYGLVCVGLIECLIIGWYYKLDHLQFHMHDASQGAHPKSWDGWWKLSIMAITPLILLVIIGWSLYEEFTKPYGGFPVHALVLFGAGWVALTLLAAVCFSFLAKYRE